MYVHDPKRPGLKARAKAARAFHEAKAAEAKQQANAAAQQAVINSLKK